MSQALLNLDLSLSDGYAQIGGVRLHYVTRGTGDRLVILLHGFPECWYSWRHQLIALGDKYTVVAPDMRGYNLSDKPIRVEDYKLNLLVDDVLGLVRHFGARNAAIVGHDWGAAVAWSVAENYPDYVWKLVTMQVPPAAVWRANMSVKQALMSWYMLLFQIPRVPEWLLSSRDYAFIERIFKKSVARRGTFTDTDIDVYKEALKKPGALTAAINYYRANGPSKFFNAPGRNSQDVDERRIRVPTLFIYGEKDQAVMPATVCNVGAHVDAPYRELRIATSAHWVQNEAVLEVNAALQSFLASA